MSGVPILALNATPPPSLNGPSVLTHPCQGVPAKTIPRMMVGSAARANACRTTKPPIECAMTVAPSPLPSGPSPRAALSNLSRSRYWTSSAEDSSSERRQSYPHEWNRSGGRDGSVADGEGGGDENGNERCEGGCSCDEETCFNRSLFERKA